MDTHTDTARPGQQHYCLFDTAIGTFAVAWSERGLTRLQLPESDRDAAEQRIRRLVGGRGRGPETPPPAISQLFKNLQRYLAGNKTEFLSVIIDLRMTSPFHRRVYEAARSVGWGETATYGEIARKTRSRGRAGGRKCPITQSYRHHHSLPPHPGEGTKNWRLLCSRRHRRQSALAGAGGGTRCRCRERSRRGRALSNPLMHVLWLR